MSGLVAALCKAVSEFLAARTAQHSAVPGSQAADAHRCVASHARSPRSLQMFCMPLLRKCNAEHAAWDNKYFLRPDGCPAPNYAVSFGEHSTCSTVSLTWHAAVSALTIPSQRVVHCTASWHVIENHRDRSCPHLQVVVPAGGSRCRRRGSDGGMPAAGRRPNAGAV